jgi:hypothetical protein
MLLALHHQATRSHPPSIANTPAPHAAAPTARAVSFFAQSGHSPDEASARRVDEFRYSDSAPITALRPAEGGDRSSGYKSADKIPSCRIKTPCSPYPAGEHRSQGEVGARWANDDRSTHKRSMQRRGRSFRLQSVRLARDQNADETFSRNGCNRENRMRTQSL